MKIEEYFEKNKGMGVLSTADAAGKVNSAIYARPHVFSDQEIAFIMADRLTHANLQFNPHLPICSRKRALAIQASGCI